MKHQIIQKIEIPQGVSCEYSNFILKCKKDSQELTRKIKLPEVEIKIENNNIIFKCDKGTKKHHKTIYSYIAHIKNLFQGLEKKFIYKLEACNVHFPMSIKVEGNEVIITNFFGEKTQRRAKILPNVQVEIKGHQITLSSSDIEAAGQTAANLEKATKIKKRDKRIFQDGIYIVEKPRRFNNV